MNLIYLLRRALIPDNQEKLLIDLCRTANISVPHTFLTLVNWQRSGKPLLKNFVPYAYHILRVNMLFHIGLQHDLISTRPTNTVDLEYLYYLPFCQIFTSNDKLHLNLAPLLIRKDQYFINLKQDLKTINEQLAQMSEEERDQFKKSSTY